MKRLSLLTGAASIAALSLSTQAHAAPAIVYMPDAAVDLVPTERCPIPQGGQSNAGLGCGGTSTAGGATVEPFEGDLPGLVDGLSAAVAAYDVMVTTTRPPEYVPYMMLMPSNVDNLKSASFTCTGVSTNCGALKRNGIGFTFGLTENCATADPLAEVLYAFGRMSGLEGVDNIVDAMNYPPDFSMPAAGFEDSCNTIVAENGFDDQGNPTTVISPCTSRQHLDCAMDGTSQNSHLDLLEAYGPRVEDTAAPTFENLVPADGAEVMVGEFILGVDLVDEDMWASARWTVSSDNAAWQEFVPGGTLTKCTNSACGVAWGDGNLKPTDSDWGFSEPQDAPPGEYMITLEAADFHGNISDPVTFTVTVVVAPGADSGGADGTGTAGGGDAFDGGNEGTGTSAADGGGAADGNANDDGGCSCSTTSQGGGMMFLLVGLLGLGLRKRD